MSLEEKFQAAATIVQKLPKTGPLVLTDDKKLEFYSLYKQATMGENKETPPSFVHFIEKAKWTAWKKLGNMSSDEAKEKYIDLVKETIDEMSKTMNVNEWLQQIDSMLTEKLALIKAN
uniref:ACB domain-containing protein n=1 Tax=Setaria digitata TaxID=48799 RepID=A0A915PRL0_9BILA